MFEIGSNPSIESRMQLASRRMIDRDALRQIGPDEACQPIGIIFSAVPIAIRVADFADETMRPDPLQNLRMGERIEYRRNVRCIRSRGQGDPRCSRSHSGNLKKMASFHADYTVVLKAGCPSFLKPDARHLKARCVSF